jgi:hypothetical protein
VSSSRPTDSLTPCCCAAPAAAAALQHNLALLNRLLELSASRALPAHHLQQLALMLAVAAAQEGNTGLPPAAAASGRPPLPYANILNLLSDDGDGPAPPSIGAAMPPSGTASKGGRRVSRASVTNAAQGRLLPDSTPAIDAIKLLAAAAAAGGEMQQMLLQGHALNRSSHAQQQCTNTAPGNHSHTAVHGGLDLSAPALCMHEQGVNACAPTCQLNME